MFYEISERIFNLKMETCVGYKIIRTTHTNVVSGPLLDLSIFDAYNISITHPTHTRTHTHKRTRTRASTHTHKHTHKHTCMHAHIRAHTEVG